MALSNERDADLRAGIERLERFADLTDTKFRIPIIGVRFGIEAVIGLLPVIGDAVGVLLALYLFFEGYRLGAPKGTLLRMLFNIVVDFLVGLVPIIGDVADIAYKANSKNARLLRRWAEESMSPAATEVQGLSGVKPKRAWLSRLLYFILILLVMTASFLLLRELIAFMDLRFS